MNIAVIAGGTSTERDVSLVTSKNVCESLRRNGHNANMIDVFLGTEKYTDAKEFFNDVTDLDSLAEELKKMSEAVGDMYRERVANGESFFGSNVLEICKAADIVYIGLHGANGEDGKIQATFDLLGIKYTGTDYMSSALSMDKQITKKMLVLEGVPMPKGLMLRKGHMVEYVPYPCVVKPCCGGSSVGVSIVNNDNEFRRAIDIAFSYEDSIMVEEYVKGREFSVAVIDGKALPVIEIIVENGFYDYNNKYSGKTKEVCPADLPQEISEKMKRMAEKTCDILGITTCARVDQLLNEDGDIYVLEVNTLPGMTPSSLIPQEAKASGMSYDELTAKIVEISMAKYE